MMTSRLVLLACLGLGGCGSYGGPPLVSGQFPPTTLSSNSEPQPIGSLPPGAENFGTAPGAYQPSLLSWTFGNR